MARSTKEEKVSKKRNQKLEICLTECAKQIKKFYEAEVNWDEDSTYLMTSKYKERCVIVYEKLARIKKTSHYLRRKIKTKFVFNDSKYPSVNRKIEKYIAKKILTRPIDQTRPINQTRAIVKTIPIDKTRTIYITRPIDKTRPIGKIRLTDQTRPTTLMLSKN